jgi:hypothetical protein
MVLHRPVETAGVFSKDDLPGQMIERR